MSQPPRGAVLQVYVLKDGHLLGTDMFAENRVVIGRDASAQLQLDSTNVSRNHAVIEHDGERIKIRDTGSTNGIFVGTEKVSEHVVGRFDEIRIGEFTLKLKLVNQATPAKNVDEPTRVLAAPVAQTDTSDNTVIDPRVLSAIASEASKTVVPEPEPLPNKGSSTKRKGSKASPVVPSPWQSSATGTPVSAVTGSATVPAPTQAQTKTQTSTLPKEPTPTISEGAGVPERMPLALRRALREEKLEATKAALLHDGHDEEDAEMDLRASFSLADELTRSTRAQDAGANQLEVLTLKGDSITAAALLKPGESFWVGHASAWQKKRSDQKKRERMVKFLRRGECLVEVSATASGHVIRAGHTLDIKEVAKKNKQGRLQVSLKPGEIVDITEAAARYHARYVSPPTLPLDARPWQQRVRLDRVLERSIGGSVALHLALLIFGFLLPTHDVAPPPEESFAEVTLTKEMKLEEPPAPPEPVQPEKVNPTPEPVAKKMQAAPNKKAKVGGTAKAPPGVLGLLQKTGSSSAPGPAAALAAVSNLSAANAPAGSAGFRVAGLAGKLPTSDIALGGGGGVQTKSGSELLRGGGGGGGQLSGKGERAVGGLVQKMPQAMRSQGGSLDRDAIQKVINENIGQVQRCYERELTKTPGLSGKVEMEWVINTSGGVKSARQKFSSLDSTNVANCILEKIRGWRFPQPKGGDVVVTYPFVFKAI